MLVKQIMTGSPKTVTPETGLLEVVSLMCLYRFSGLPVVEGDKMVGFIAEKDVLHKLFPTLEDMVADRLGAVDFDGMMNKYRDVVNLKVRDLMTTNVISVSPDDHILKAASTMVRNRFRRIPVADAGELVGVLSLGDVHKAVFQSVVSAGMGGR
ncbi:MAG: CBS domain-containing protein [Chromatiaceae bacterium]|nr:CBS domain-containing protein [Gammaproteobacteria bacterium]MCB1879695.1 CBS domain-containing protein [Gammaproteobacteria bacterium]MCP5427254.1 CBS domain-containing protein [Chromatiaceae bacterium]MCP5447909.1 CBS domain-containing protein [Chromatiaceae bacterium]